MMCLKKSAFTMEDAYMIHVFPHTLLFVCFLAQAGSEPDWIRMQTDPEGVSSHRPPDLFRSKLDRCPSSINLAVLMVMCTCIATAINNHPAVWGVNVHRHNRAMALTTRHIQKVLSTGSSI